MTVYVERPWVEYFESLKYSNKSLEQQMKLIRNQAASLDLGNPHFKLFDSHFNRNRDPRERPDSRTAYLEWVVDWKRTYNKLSETIRALKAQRKFKGTAAHETRLKRDNPNWDNASIGELHDRNNDRIREAMPALKRAAQVMLNARYNAKLAAAELRRRRLAEAPVAE